MKILPLLAIALLLGTAVPLAAATSTAHPRTPARANLPFTAMQAWNGRLTYYAQCAECHGGNLQGQIGPALAGPNARDQWESPQYIYSYYSAHMPHGNPGRLSKAEYLNIMAFLLEQHGGKSGPRALTEPQVLSASKKLGP